MKGSFLHFSSTLSNFKEKKFNNIHNSDILYYFSGTSVLVKILNLESQRVQKLESFFCNKTP